MSARILDARVVWLGCLGLVLAIAGCSDSEKTKAKSDSAPAFSVFAAREGAADDGIVRRVAGDDDADPVIERLSLEPAAPEARGRLRAVTEMTGRWTSLEYAWKINGAAFGGGSAEVVVPVVKTGDTISVEVVPIRGAQRGAAKTASVRVENQKPMLLGLSIDRAEDDRRELRDDTDVWKAAVRAEDPDGDRIRFSYRWFLNGEESDQDSEFFVASGLTRGDRLEVEVRASDGKVSTAPARSGQVEVGNSAPEIVSSPPRVDARGQFRYDVRVEDGDGDRNFRFALRQAPRGMQIDDINGIVRWAPGTDQEGRHSVEIVVTDEGGAESTQSFSLALIQQTEDSVPASAR
jgi:hypothetical protein